MAAFQFLVVKFHQNLKLSNLGQLWPPFEPILMCLYAKSLHVWFGTIPGFQKDHFLHVQIFQMDLWNSWVRMNKLSFSALARSFTLGKLCIHHVCPIKPAWALQKPVVCVSEVIESIYLEGQISPFLIHIFVTSSPARIYVPTSQKYTSPANRRRKVAWYMSRVAQDLEIVAFTVRILIGT